MMTKEIADNILGCMDGEDVPSNDLVRAVKQFGAKEVHTDFVNHMQKRGWRDGAVGTTNKELLISPHVRPWKLLVKAQTDPYEACDAMSVRENKIDVDEAYQADSKDSGMNDGVENV